jgi:peptidoglycan/xylan/chitin deacetylase (PgdA/CDA1 family)
VDRRGFLKGAALVGGGVALGATGQAINPLRHSPEWLDGEQAEASSYANEFWGDPALDTTRIIWKVDTDEKLLALTFDDGPKPENTLAVLDVLEAKKVRATFNLVGSRALAYPDLVRRELAGKHEIGNHTWSHGDLAFLSRRDTEAQLRRADEAIERVTGRRPSIFRPPKGHLTGTALASATRLGYDVVLWSLQLHETAFDAAGNARYVADNVTPGTILLAHDVGNPSRRVGLSALPLLIDQLRDRGYSFVTTSELLEAGHPVPPPPPS